MIIKQYDIYTLQLNEFSHKKINSIKESIDLYYIRIFLLYSLRGVSNFIKAIETYSKDGMIFELVTATIDNQNNLVYFSESWHDYKDKPTTPEIEQLLEEENFIQLCKMGFLDYLVMTKDNFMHILLTWDNILKQLPPFALLYLDDQNWYDIKAFDSQQAMEQFVSEHIQQN